MSTFLEFVGRFNPRSCARSDAVKMVMEVGKNQFQSTLLCTERLSGIVGAVGNRSFNPRSCARSDKRDIEEIAGYRVSIHAPVQGAT